MDRILQSFKDLYKGDNIVYKHIMLMLLFIFPALFCGILSCFENNFKGLEPVLFILASVFLVLSIIPGISLLGYYVSFIHNRLNNIEGIPFLDKEVLFNGLKSIPVFFVWGFYSFILFLSALFLIFLASFTASTLVDDNLIKVLLVILFLLFFMLLIFIFSLLISPFILLVYVKYSENFKYSAEIFNPLTIISYMRKAFKDTIFTCFKFVAVSFVMNFLTQFIITLLYIFVFLLLMVLFLCGIKTFNFQNIDTSTIIVSSCVLAISFVIFSYVSTLIQYAYIDNLVDIYKDKILVNSQDVSSEVVVENSDENINDNSDDKSCEE